jgi:hypothetical protein
MEKLRTTKRILNAAVLLAGSLVMNSASLHATPITGILNTTGSVAVTSSTIDFLPAGTGTGDFGVDPFTQTGTFTGLAGTSGTIKDLNMVTEPVGSPFVLTDWLVFTADPTIRFTLTSLPFGVFPVAGCTGPAVAGQNCTPPGSPFNLSNTSETSSVVSFKTGGTVLNTATSEVSNFDGTFSTQFTNQNLQQLLATIQGGGSVSATYSANFIVSSPEGVPEPATITFMLGGLALIVVGAARKKRASSAV